MGFGGGLGGGGVLGLGPATNTFGTVSEANRAAAEAIRDTYQAANAEWLAIYNGNLSFWIRLVWNGGVAEQRRNAASNAWEDVTNVIRGQAGQTGKQARFPIIIHTNSAIQPVPATPVGGTYNIGTGVLVPPAGTTEAPTAPSAGQDVWASQSTIDPQTQFGEIVPIWSEWVERTHLSAGISHVERTAELTGTGLTSSPLGIADAITRDVELATLVESLSASGFAITITKEDGTQTVLRIPDDLVDVTGVGLPALDATNYKRLFIDHDTPRVWVGHKEEAPAVGAQGTFNNYADPPNFLGAHTIAPLDYVANQYYYGAQRHVWRHTVRIGTDYFWRDTAYTNLFTLGGSWLGEQPNDATAVNLIDPTTFNVAHQYLYYRPSDNRIRILDNSSYQAAVGPHPVYVAEPISAPGGVSGILGVTAGAGLGGGGISGVVSLSIDVALASFPTIPLVKGGTGAINKVGARAALGAITFTYAANAPMDRNGTNGDVHLRTSDGAWYVKKNDTWGLPVYTDRTASGGTGLDEDAVNILIAAALGDAVTSNTESRIVVTYNADGTLDFQVSAPAFHSGAGVPNDAATGTNGDLYLRTSNGAWYFKANDVWGNPIYTPAAGGGTTIITGTNDPQVDEGVNGNLFLQTTTGSWYFKIADAWGDPIYTSASQTDLTALIARVTTLEGYHVQPSSHTRYAAFSADAVFTEIEWLAGNTSQGETIEFPVTVAAHNKGFAIPADETSLTVIQQAGNAFNERASYLPAVGAADVLQNIGGVSHKTYIKEAQDFPGAAQDFEIR